MAEFHVQVDKQSYENVRLVILNACEMAVNTKNARIRFLTNTEDLFEDDGFITRSLHSIFNIPKEEISRIIKRGPFQRDPITFIKQTIKGHFCKDECVDIHVVIWANQENITQIIKDFHSEKCHVFIASTHEEVYTTLVTSRCTTTRL